jgi:hypothetical protein
LRAYQTSQYVVPLGGIFLGKWRSYFAGSSDGKTNIQSACALNARYTYIWNREMAHSTLPLCNSLLDLIETNLTVSRLSALV